MAYFILLQIVLWSYGIVSMWWSCDVTATGRVHPGEDIVVFLSHSGQTEECVTTVKQLKDRGIDCLCIVSQPSKEWLWNYHIGLSGIAENDIFGIIPLNKTSQHVHNYIFDGGLIAYLWIKNWQISCKVIFYYGTSHVR